MKKLLSLLLLLAMCVSMLVACKEEKIGDYEYDYVEDVKEEITLNMYIISPDPNAEAINTVQREIREYALRKFKVKLEVKYFSESEYATKVDEAMASDASEAQIVLINSDAMFYSLVGADKLVNLDFAFDSNQYGMLNAEIARPLLDAAKHQKEGAEAASHYCVPNNRVLGTYTYMTIDREIAHTLGYSLTALESMLTYEDTATLRADIEATGKNPADYVKIVENGMYEDKEAYEDIDHLYCAILKKPEVTKADAYRSAFAITTDCAEEYYNRAMEIVYAINMDTTLRNLLQYGVKNTNYYLDASGENVIFDGVEENRVYRMDLMYTGNLYKALFCEAYGFTPEVAQNGNKQNADAYYAAPEAN